MSAELGTGRAMDGGTTFAFQAAGGGSWRGGAGTAAPEPERDPPPPEREWGLSAGQVAAVVLTIIAACELIGLLG